jgi:predicted DsbA family dithiol-disulfide isomerase
MTTTLKIDFVSDVSCPWCIIGLKALEPEGQDIGEHLQEKYGATPEQSQQNREAIAQRGAALGFTFNMDKRSRIYNTFDAHRLLHWAEDKGLQAALKKALFQAYFTDGQSPGDHDVLVRVAGEVGLDATEAREVLSSGRYAAEVREREQFYQQHGIHSVPAIIVNDRHLIQGGQPVEVFEQALRQIAAEK